MSGNKVPATNIYLRTAPASASNAIFEVFGKPAGNNLVALAGSNVDTGTRPPGYSVTNTVPTAASGNLKMSYFAGKSVFLTAPSTYNIGNITTTTLTPALSGGNGTSYQIAVGTTAGTSNTVGWRAATNNTQITSLTFTVGSNYYISAYSSNATNGTASLAVSNASAYGIPNPATGVTLTITSLSNWSFSWTAPGSGIAPTGYLWFLNTTNSTTAGSIANGTTSAPTVTTGTQSTTLAGGSTYYGLVYAVRPEASSTLAASAGVLSVGAPTNFQITSMTTSTVNFSWTAVSGATSYTLSYSGTASGSVTGIPSGTTYAWTVTGLGDGGYTCTLAAIVGGSPGPSSGAAYFGKYITPTTSSSYSVPVAKAYKVLMSGAGGGGGSYNNNSIPYNQAQSRGGSGSYITGTVTLSVTSYIVKVGGGGIPALAGTNGGGLGQSGNFAVSGGGGGYSQFGIYNATTSMVAGGGGGGGGAGQNTVQVTGDGGNGATTTSYAGSAGGTAYAFDCDPCGGPNSAGANGGGGATTSAVGVGGIATSGYTNSGSSGSGQTGGNCGYNVGGSVEGGFGGGGGGGYFGGGGGGGGYNNSIVAGSGGGAGSSYAGTGFTSVSLGTGSAGGYGATTGREGGNGYVLIYG